MKKDLPKYFNQLKKEFERVTRLYFFQNKEEVKSEPKGDMANYDYLSEYSEHTQGEFYLMLKSFEAFIAEKLIAYEDKLLEHTLSEKPIVLLDYQKTIKYDDEASWISLSDSTSKELKERVDKGE